MIGIRSIVDDAKRRWRWLWASVGCATLCIPSYCAVAYELRSVGNAIYQTRIWEMICCLPYHVHDYFSTIWSARLHYNWKCTVLSSAHRSSIDTITNPLKSSGCCHHPSHQITTAKDRDRVEFWPQSDRNLIMIQLESDRDSVRIWSRSNWSWSSGGIRS